MAYWLMKSEPSVYGWPQMVAEKKTAWSGVRNYEARNNMQAMKKGDQVFFYHSNEGKEIVGIMEVVREFHPDPEDETGKFGLVDVRALKPLKTPVTLATLKADKRFSDLALIKRGRISVTSVSDAHWTAICKLGGVA
jgi:predicted RNA-binding protein with PUA-like domain